MKKLVIIGSVMVLMASCEKKELNLFDKKDKICATVSSENVPQEVRDAFAAKYPGITVTAWFNKDDVGYTALFTQNGSETLTQFDNSGNFVKEEIDASEGDHKDKSKDSGCECELNGGD